MTGKLVSCCCMAFLIFLVYVNAMALAPPTAMQRQMPVVPVWTGGCGDNLCDCQNHVAFCSTQKFGARIPYLPKLPADIREVVLSHNGLTSQVMNEEFFINVSTIRTLGLARNNLTVIHPSTFKRMRRLRQLDISENHHLTLISLKVLLSIRTLRVLLVSDCNLGQFPPGVFEGMQSNIEQLWLQRNSLKLLNLADVSLLGHLVQLDVSSNAIHDILPDRLRHLRRLVLTNNTLANFPITCRNGVSLFPNLEDLRLENNHIATIGPDICLPELSSLDVSRNAFDILDSQTFSVTKFPKLVSLFFCCQQMLFPVQNYAFNNTNLIHLDFAANNLDFSSDSFHGMGGVPVGRHTLMAKQPRPVQAKAFENCASLRMLLLDNNDFGNVDDDRLHQLLGHLPLIQLFIRYSHFSYITTQTFAKFTLLRNLYLEGNKITSIPKGTFDTLTNLRVLDLSANRIASVHQDSFSEAMRTQLTQLSLKANPFICDCELLWFKGWLHSSHTLFYANGNGLREYMCANIAGTTVADFSMEEQACLLSAAMSVQAILTCSLLIVALTSFSLVFRYRWHIRLLLYEAFRGRNDTRRRLLEAGNFRYDVFVSYASEQLPWVRQHLLPELEVRLGLKVCDHERDFIPGKNILDNIADCLDSSKKMVMVFSRDFVTSEWCQFELAVCLRHAMDHDDSPIIVCVDDVASRDMTSAMMAVLKFTTYIQWEEEAYAMDSFWGRLHLALNDLFQHGQLDRQL